MGVPVHAEDGKVTVQASAAQGVHAAMVLEPVPGAVGGQPLIIQSCLVPDTGYPPRKEEEECPSYFNPSEPFVT